MQRRPGGAARRGLTKPSIISMAVLESRIDVASAEFQRNDRHHRALGRALRELVARIALGGDERSRRRHVERGKLLVRDRVRGLLDAGSPFLEIGQLAGHALYDDAVPAAGLVAGIGRVAGAECMIVANDATVKGGTYYPITVKKHLRAQEIALENHLPCIYLWIPAAPSCPCRRGCFQTRSTSGGSSTTRPTSPPPAFRSSPCDGIVHRWRRLRAGDVRPGRHRAESGHHLPWRAAAGEGCHRGGGGRREPGRAAMCIPAAPE